MPPVNLTLISSPPSPTPHARPGARRHVTEAASILIARGEDVAGQSLLAPFGPFGGGPRDPPGDMEGLSRQERRRLAREVVDQQVTIGSLDSADGRMRESMIKTMRFPQLVALVARRAGRCDACGAKRGDGGVKLSTCRTCQGVSYCGKDCQKAEWLTHKPICRVRAPRRGVE